MLPSWNWLIINICEKTNQVTLELFLKFQGQVSGTCPKGKYTDQINIEGHVIKSLHAGVSP